VLFKVIRLNKSRKSNHTFLTYDKTHVVWEYKIIKDTDCGSSFLKSKNRKQNTIVVHFQLLMVARNNQNVSLLKYFSWDSLGYDHHNHKLVVELLLFFNFFIIYETLFSVHHFI